MQKKRVTPMVHLPSGYSIPSLGLGTFQSYVQDHSVGSVKDAVKHSVKSVGILCVVLYHNLCV